MKNISRKTDLLHLILKGDDIKYLKLTDKKLYISYFTFNLFSIKLAHVSKIC